VKIHYLQHAAGEGPGEIENWAAANGHALTGTHWYRGDARPEAEGIDFLVIMGGGMNIHQHREHPWLAAEKGLIEEVIGLGKPVLGICLGAQLIADVMGGRVYQNAEYEIGWFPVRMAEGAGEHRLFAPFPKELKVLHWHGDTFALPAGATLVASSDACRHQAFMCGEGVVGLQFHAEVRPEDVRFFVQGETGPLPEGRHVQTFEEILGGDSNIPAVHQALRGLLDAMTAE
jgi:GMP synthase-like glutamine amidotransferase